VFESYRKFAEHAAKARGTVRERVRAGRADQIVLLKERASYPEFEVRAVAANGLHWTGTGGEAASRLPPQAGLAEEDRAPENPCSIALRVRHGRFTYFTGGDLYGQ